MIAPIPVRTSSRRSAQVLRALMAISTITLIAMNDSPAVVARHQAKSPRFEDASVTAAEKFKGRPATVKLTTRQSKLYRTMIREGARKGPNFAGHFTIVQWGCGTGCVQFEIVNARTGVVYDPPFAVALGVHSADDSSQPDEPLQFRLESKLMIVSGAPNEENEGVYFYKWDGKQLVLLTRRLFENK